MGSRSDDVPEYDPLVEDPRFDRDELGLDPEDDEFFEDEEEDEGEEDDECLS